MKKTSIFLIWTALLVMLSGCVKIDIPMESSLQEKLDSSDQSIKTNEEYNSFMAPSFNSLELNIGQGTMYIRTGDTFSYTQEDGKEASFEIIDNTLHINQNQDHKTILTLSDKLYASLSIKAHESHIYTESGLTVQSFVLNATHGEVKLSSLSIADKSDITINQGSAFLSGELGTVVVASCKEGHLNLELYSSKNEYNFKISLLNSNIYLGTEDYHGRSVSKNIDNGADRSMTLNCSQGDISVEFSANP